MGAEAHWLMGRVMPREFLEEIGKYLHQVAPEREDEQMAAIKARAEERPTTPSPDTPTSSTGDSSTSSNPADTLLVVACRSSAKEGY
jgi:hypothetical protein